MMKKIYLITNILFMFSTFQIYAEIYEVNNNKILKLMRDGVPLIDIRTKKEWYQTGIINNSKKITFFDEGGNYDLKIWMTKLREIANKNDPLIIICRSGRRSRIVANLLNSKFGYKNVYHATNGILSWKSDKRKTIMPE